MQFLTVALLALAAGIEASPAGRRGESPCSGGLAAPTGSGIFPVATGYVPTGVSAGVAAPTGLQVRATSTKKTSAKKTSAKKTSTKKSSAKATSTKKASSTPKASAANDTEAPVTTTPSKAAPAAGGKLPASSGTSVLKAVQTIAAGQSFDGGMKMIDRGVSCTGQSEGGDGDAVFEIEEGGSLSNVIIGPNQIEGVHCFGACTLTNVWWSAVCEDAFTIKEQKAGDTTKVIGGGAFGAEDKVLQHNGAGTMSVSGFTVSSFGKLYRSCGNCKVSNERHVIFEGISATDGKSLAGINPNFGDTATFKNVEASGVKEICVEYQGTTPGNEPKKVSSGPSDACIYSASDVTA